MNSVALTLWRSAKPVGYWTVQSARFDYVASIGLPFDALTLAQGRLLTSLSDIVRLPFELRAT